MRVVVVVVEGSSLPVRTLQTNFGFMNSLQGGEIPASPVFLIALLWTPQFASGWQPSTMFRVLQNKNNIVYAAGL